jgi:hypothetical protein
MADLGWADLLVIGTWVEGLVLAGRPARGTRLFLRGLPHLAGKKVALYCTYTVSPGHTLAGMRRPLEAADATIVGECEFSHRTLATGPQHFAVSLVDRLWPAVTTYEVADRARQLAAGGWPDAAGELAWFAGGRRALLRDTRALLRERLRADPGDEAAHAAARLVVAALARHAETHRGAPAARQRRLAGAG